MRLTSVKSCTKLSKLLNRNLIRVILAIRLAAALRCSNMTSNNSSSSTTPTRNIMTRSKITGLKCMGTNRATKLSPITSRGTPNSMAKTATMAMDNMGRTSTRGTPMGTRMRTSIPTLITTEIRVWGTSSSSTAMIWRVGTTAKNGMATPAIITAGIMTTITEPINTFERNFDDDNLTFDSNYFVFKFLKKVYIFN